MSKSVWLTGLTLVWLGGCAADSSLGSGTDRDEQLSSSTGGGGDVGDAGNPASSSEPTAEAAANADDSADDTTDDGLSSGADSDDSNDEGATDSEPVQGEDAPPSDDEPAPDEDASDDGPSDDEPASGEGARDDEPAPDEGASDDGPSDDEPAPGEGASDDDISDEEASESGVVDEGEQADACAVYAEYTSIDYDEFDTSYWVSEEECTFIAEMRTESVAQVDLDVAPLAGTWRSGEEEVELVLDETGHGTLRYGEAAELPPIEDPTEAYLVDDLGIIPTLGAVPFRSGFTYTVYPTTGRAGEMTFGVRNAEPWQEWCELQPPQRSNSCYACEIGAGMGMTFIGDSCPEYEGCYLMENSSEQVWLQVDCDRMNLCGDLFPVCDCDSEACGASVRTVERTINLDPIDTSVLRVPDRLDGETLYLERVQ